MQVRRDCENTNWEQKGYDDGSQGDRADNYELNNCAALVNVKVKDLYSSGYTKGVSKFCTYEYGTYWGRSGRQYNNICPSSLENNFLSGYSRGKLEYDQLQIQKQNADSMQKLVEHAIPGNSFPQAKGCFSSFDCEVKDKCIQDPQSRFGTDRICQKRPMTKCFSDWDCEIKGACEDRLCRYKIK